MKQTLRTYVLRLSFLFKFRIGANYVEFPRPYAKDVA